MDGSDLRQLFLDKWGHSYDVQLRRQGDRVLFLVMWRYCEQASFPLTEDEYCARLQRVAACLNDWSLSAEVRESLQTTKHRPRLGKAVCLTLQPKTRASEWLLEEVP
ncbi:MAG TPA: DUF3067 domain-containing protein [Cyanobacteria bacterium UBA8156]|jgi:predicted metalloprotease with PDZ domain|nr:DUF3067 domain-containing protein [Cyanobacteria bacterium UBA8156]